uniref:Nitrite reductase n=1 Tax=Periophthalmus magnuspinnatus TaxID=409849 RepID=A0A3B4ABM3_9GOBI
MDLLSEKDKELIRGSWESLGKNKVPHGVIMFSLFELDPELLTLFYHRTKCSSSQDCLSSPEFVEHVTKVMLVIDAAVSNLDDLPSLEDFTPGCGSAYTVLCSGGGRGPSLHAAVQFGSGLHCASATSLAQHVQHRCGGYEPRMGQERRGQGRL